MSAPAVAAPVPDNNEALQQLRECRAALEHGFEATNSPDRKHAFMQAILAVSREIEEILGKAINERTERYKAATADVRQVVTRLENLKNEIANLITNLETAAKYIAAIEKVITMLAQFVP